MLRSLVGSEMCIRDRRHSRLRPRHQCHLRLQPLLRCHSRRRLQPPQTPLSPLRVPRRWLRDLDELFSSPADTQHEVCFCFSSLLVYDGFGRLLCRRLFFSVNTARRSFKLSAHSVSLVPFNSRLYLYAKPSSALLFLLLVDVPFTLAALYFGAVFRVSRAIENLLFAFSRARFEKIAHI